MMMFFRINRNVLVTIPPAVCINDVNERVDVRKAFVTDDIVPLVMFVLIVLGPLNPIVSASFLLPSADSFNDPIVVFGRLNVDH